MTDGDVARPATVPADDASSPPADPRDRTYTPDELARLSVSDYALVTGDYGPFDAVVDDFLRSERAKVSRAFRTLSAPAARCRRCDHLRSHHPSWPGPCTFAFCACPGPEPAG